MVSVIEPLIGPTVQFALLAALVSSSAMMHFLEQAVRNSLSKVSQVTRGPFGMADQSVLRPRTK